MESESVAFNQNIIEQALICWTSDRALDAGRILYEDLAPHTRPMWAAKIVSFMYQGRPKLREAYHLLEIATTPSRWSEAKNAFVSVRRLTLKAKGNTTDEAFFLLLENFAKIIYNASFPQDPYDQDAGWWFVKITQCIQDENKSNVSAEQLWNVITLTN